MKKAPIFVLDADHIHPKTKACQPVSRLQFSAVPLRLLLLRAATFCTLRENLTGAGTPCNGGGSARCYCSVRTGCSQGITFLSLLPSYTKIDSSLGAGVGKGRVLFTAFAE